MQLTKVLDQDCASLLESSVQALGMSCFIPACNIGSHLPGLLTTQWRSAVDWGGRYSGEHMGAYGCFGCQPESTSYAASASSTTLLLVSLLSHQIK